MARGGWGVGVSAADFDNDGLVDLYLTNLGPDVLFRNNGDGTFTDVTERAGVRAPGWSTSAAFGDFDGDGWLDLYVAGYLDVGPDTLPGAGRRQLRLPRRARAVRPARAARGRRTTTSATTATARSPSGRRLRGLRQERYFGLGVVGVDYDNDGGLDIYVANDATPELPLPQPR